VVPGVDPPPGETAYSIDWSRVNEDFFDAAAVRIVDGRAFAETDNRNGNPVAIVSEAFVRKFWPGRSAIGSTIRIAKQETTVIGVAADSKIKSLGEDPIPYVYRPFAQSPTSGMTVVARSQGNASALLAAVVVVDVKTMERYLAASLLPHRLGAWVISAFGSLALLLAAIGLFGVVSYAVSTRQREVGIRMAMGATAGQIVRLMMGGGMRLVAIGVAIGLALSAAAAKVLSGVLYGVNATDAIAFIVAPIVLLGVAVAASWIPARRVTRISPVQAIKAD
jgi:ABC-type antimicrobial peptide transport system permease subunit